MAKLVGVYYDECGQEALVHIPEGTVDVDAYLADTAPDEWRFRHVEELRDSDYYARKALEEEAERTGHFEDDDFEDAFDEDGDDAFDEDGEDRCLSAEEDERCV